MTYEFPEELLKIQRDFFDAEARAATAETSEAFQKAMEDQQDAAIAKHRSDFWAQVPGDRYKADLALRDAAREAQAPAE